METKTCSMCKNKAFLEGLCKKHYVAKRTEKEGAICMVEGCDAPQFRYPYCSLHHNRHSQFGDVHLYKGIRTLDITDKTDTNKSPVKIAKPNRVTNRYS